MNQTLTLQLHTPPPYCTWCNEVSDFVPVVTSKYGSVGGEVGTVGKALLRAGTPLVRTSYAVPVGMEMLRWGMISASQFKGSDLQIEMLVRVARLHICQPVPACRKHILVRCEGCGATIILYTSQGCQRAERPLPELDRQLQLRSRCFASSTPSTVSCRAAHLRTATPLHFFHSACATSY